MKKIINKNLTLYFNNKFPYQNINISNKKYLVFLGIGGNIGNIGMRFKKLILSLKNDSRFYIFKTSPMLKNPPFGYTEQDDFLNAIIVVKTDLPPFVLLREMQRYENRFGRTRSFKNAPRKLDIDILNIKKLNQRININHKKLIVPHPGIQNRYSVTIPLKYIKIPF